MRDQLSPTHRTDSPIAPLHTTSLFPTATLMRGAALFLLSVSMLGAGCKKELESVPSPDEAALRQRVLDAHKLHQEYYRDSTARFLKDVTTFQRNQAIPEKVRSAFLNPKVAEVLDALRVGESTLNLQTDISQNPCYGDPVRREVVTVLQWSLLELQRTLVAKLETLKPNEKWTTLGVSSFGTWGPQSQRLRSHVTALVDVVYEAELGSRHITRKPNSPHDTGIGPVMAGILDHYTDFKIATLNRPQLPYRVIVSSAGARGRGFSLETIERDGNKGDSYARGILYMAGMHNPKILDELYSTNQAGRACALNEVASKFPAIEPDEEWRTSEERQLNSLLAGALGK